MLFTDNISGRNFAKDPAVVKLSGTYYLYYSVPPTTGKKGWYIGIASSSDLESFKNINYIKPSQECEKNGICAPGAIVLNNQIHLFYQTYGNGFNDAICHAVSNDGENFVKDSDNPIYHPNDNWCSGRAIDADVCVFRNKLYMYFATRDFDGKIQQLGGATAPLNSDFSKSAWRSIEDKTLLSPELDWEMSCIEAPAVTVFNNKIYLFYGGSYNCSPQQIGCAVSNDGKTFKRIFATPFLACGTKGEWNESESGHPFIFEDDEKIYLFYQGCNDNGKTWYISKREISFNNDIPVLL